MASEVHSQIFIQTGNHPPGDSAGGTLALQFPWVSNWPSPFYIKRAQLFMGAWPGMKLDFDCDLTLQRKAGGTDYILRAEWDHYADPTSAWANNPYIDFGMDYMTVSPGDVVNLQVQTNGPIVPNTYWGVQVQLYYKFTL